MHTKIVCHDDRRETVGGKALQDVASLEIKTMVVFAQCNETVCARGYDLLFANLADAKMARITQQVNTDEEIIHRD